MRISTMARVKGAIFLLAVLALVPQFAFAQLPIETRDLRLQGGTSGDVITIKAPNDVGLNYSLTYPNNIGAGKGAFLFLASTDGSSGQFKWSSTVATTGHIPVWDDALTEIRWVGADSDLFPVWSLNGNLLANNSKRLGSNNSTPFDIVTDNQTRVVFASNGDISINTTNNGANTTIGRAAGHTTAINGTLNVLGTTTINADNNTAVTNIGTGTTTGAVTIGGGSDQAITIGTGAAVKTVALGSNTTTSSTTILGGAGGTLDLNNGAGGSTTNIGTGATTGAVTIGGGSNQAIAIGTGGAVKTVSLGSNNTTSATTILGGDGGSLNLHDGAGASTTNIGTGATTGAVTIGGTGTQTINVGNGAGVKTVNLGSSNTTSATNILGGSGSVNINDATVSNTNINTTSGASTVNIGNAASTLNVLGATNINTSGATLTSIGNSAGGADTRFSGEIQMETDPGDAGDVLLSNGAGNTPSWKDLNDAIGIRKVGVQSVSNAVSADVTSITNFDPANDAIIITMIGTAGGSTVVPTVTARAAGQFTVTFSAAYTGSFSYLVMRQRN